MTKALSVLALAAWFVLMAWGMGAMIDYFDDDPYVSHFMLAFAVFAVIACLGWIPLFRWAMREFGV